jgi:hypothetical protein
MTLRYCIRLCLLIFLLVLCLSIDGRKAFAGHWEVSSRSYSFTPSVSGDSHYSAVDPATFIIVWNYDGGYSGTTTGSITTTWTWTNYGTDQSLPPPNVIVDEYAVAGPIKGPDGSGSTGMVVNNVVNKIAYGHQYTVKKVTGSSITVTSPTMSATVSSSQSGTGEANVFYSAEITNVDINLGGATFFNGSWRILIGQKLSASLGSNVGIVSGHNWKVGGTLFSDYIFTTVKGELIEDVVKSNSVFDGYFNSDNKSSLEVNCTASIFFPSTGQSDSLDVSRELTIAKPSIRTISKTTEHPSLDSDNTQPVIRCGSRSPDHSNTTPGFEWVAQVETSPIFYLSGTNNDAGLQTFTQLIAPTRQVLDGNGVWSDVSGWCSNGAYWLDAEPYYPGQAWITLEDSLERATITDSPQHPLTGAGVSVFDQFQAYLMYLPPGNVGQSSHWVALQSTDWQWQALVYFLNGEWQIQRGARTRITGSDNWVDQPEWNEVREDN